jgi:hypothetical protein
MSMSENDVDTVAGVTACLGSLSTLNELTRLRQEISSKGKDGHAVYLNEYVILRSIYLDHSGQTMWLTREKTARLEAEMAPDVIEESAFDSYGLTYNGGARFIHGCSIPLPEDRCNHCGGTWSLANVADHFGKTVERDLLLSAYAGREMGEVVRSLAGLRQPMTPRVSFEEHHVVQAGDRLHVSLIEHYHRGCYAHQRDQQRIKEVRDMLHDVGFVDLQDVAIRVLPCDGPRAYGYYRDFPVDVEVSLRKGTFVIRWTSGSKGGQWQSIDWENSTLPFCPVKRRNYDLRWTSNAVSFLVLSQLRTILELSIEGTP